MRFKANPRKARLAGRLRVLDFEYIYYTKSNIVLHSPCSGFFRHIVSAICLDLIGILEPYYVF